MGIEIDNPIVIGASTLVTDLDALKKAEEYGAAAIVYKSLFEEQIQLESLRLQERLNEFNDIHAEMTTIHPHIDHAGPDEHLNNIRKAKEGQPIPIIASLNAVDNLTWIKYSKLLSETGVNGIELNFYQVPWNFNKTAKAVEDEQVNIVKEIKESISIPVSVKLSSDYPTYLILLRSLTKQAWMHLCCSIHSSSLILI